MAGFLPFGRLERLHQPAGGLLKLGDVLVKERERKGLTSGEVALTLGISPDEYNSMEEGRSSAEIWGLVLAHMAIKLEIPLSRLLTGSGKATDMRQGEAAHLIASHRMRRGLSVAELAESSGCSPQELSNVEAGESQLEEMGRRLLRFAELIQQPVFNLLYPCGLPLETIENYP
jgi:transcriptional regulator with XRE-family HTH domain